MHGRGVHGRWGACVVEGPAWQGGLCMAFGQ